MKRLENNNYENIDNHINSEEEAFVNKYFAPFKENVEYENVEHDELLYAELYVSCAYEDENVRGIINELIDAAGLDDDTDGTIRLFSQYYIPYNIEICKRFRNGTEVVDHYKFDRSEIINND